MADADRRRGQLEQAIGERILILDGATGTAIQAMDLTADDFGGPELGRLQREPGAHPAGCHPAVHRGYLEAGADLIETDSFGGTRIVLAEYGLQDKVYEINHAAARLAREMADALLDRGAAALRRRLDGPGHARRSRSPTNVTFDEVRRAYAEQTVGLVEGGADVLFLETQQDTLNVKASLLGIDDAFAQRRPSRCRSCSRCRSRPGARCSPVSRSSRCTSRWRTAISSPSASTAPPVRTS